MRHLTEPVELGCTRLRSENGIATTYLGAFGHLNEQCDGHNLRSLLDAPTKRCKCMDCLLASAPLCLAIRFARNICVSPATRCRI